MVARIALAGIVATLAACAGGSPGGGKYGASTPAAVSPAYNISCIAESAQPGALPPVPGVSYGTMIVDRELRDYRLYQPPGLDKATLVPLVIVLHGTPIDAAGLEGIIHFQREADAAGLIAAYPDGCHEDWDETARSSDVLFIAALLDRLESELKVDRSRVYLIGTSAGGFMAYRLACDLPERFAAIASVTGSMFWTDCSPSMPVSIYEMHGTADMNVPYDGGKSTYRGGVQMQSVTDVIARWVRIDGCSGQPAMTVSGITQTFLWAHCTQGVEVRLDSIVGGHHTWFGSSYDPVPREPDANTEIWKFFASVGARRAPST